MILQGIIMILKSESKELEALIYGVIEKYNSNTVSISNCMPERQSEPLFSSEIVSGATLFKTSKIKY